MLNSKTYVASWLPYAGYLVLAISLLFYRLPWVDEAWFAGPAVSFMTDSSILDYGACMWRDDLPHAFLFEIYAILQSLWYSIGGVDILWGRALSVVSGLGVLMLLDRCAVLLGYGKTMRSIALVVTGSNYFLLYSATQIRPDILAILFVAISLNSHLKWRRDPSSVLFLFLEHACLILAMFLHPQAGFVALGIFGYSVFFERKHYSIAAGVSSVLPYLLATLAYGLYIVSNHDEFISRISTMFSGDMLGHKGGMIAASVFYYQSGQFTKLLVAVAAIASMPIGLFAFSKESVSNEKSIAAAYAVGGYLSWLLTTTHIADYHAVWLIFTIHLSILGLLSLLNGRLPGTRNKLLVKGLLAMFVVQSFAGMGYAAITAIHRPINDYYADLNNFSREFKLTENAVFGVRDIMWYFNFDKGTLCLSGRAADQDIRFFISNVPVSDLKLDSGHQCKKEQQGTAFSIYKCQSIDSVSQSQSKN